MPRKMKIYHALRLIDLIDLLYGYEPREKDTTAIGPLLYITPGSKYKEVTDLNKRFFKYHFCNDFVKSHEYLFEESGEFKSEPRKRDLAVSNTSNEYKGGGHTFTEEFLKTIMESDYDDDGNHLVIEEMYSRNYETLKGFSREHLRRGLSDYIKGIPDAEKNWDRDCCPNTKFSIDKEYLEEFLEYCKAPLLGFDESEEDTDDCIFACAKTLARLMIGALLRGKISKLRIEWLKKLASSEIQGTGNEKETASRNKDSLVAPGHRSIVMTRDPATVGTTPRKPFTNKNRIKPLTASQANRAQGGTYVRRDLLLDQLRKMFDEEEEKNIVFLSGMGGTGKSELARAYAYENRKRYIDIVMFTYKESGKKKNIEEKEEEYKKDKKSSLASCINSSNVLNPVSMEDLNSLGKETLIIVDNCNESNDTFLDELENCTGNADILVTTRLGAVGNYKNIIKTDSEGQGKFAYSVFEKNYSRKVHGHEKVIQEEEKRYVKKICEYLKDNAMFAALVGIRLREYKDISISECAIRIEKGISAISAKPQKETYVLTGEQKKDARAEPMGPSIEYSKDAEYKREALSAILLVLFSDILTYKFDVYESELLKLICLFPGEVFERKFIMRLLEGIGGNGYHEAASYRLLDEGIIQGDDNCLVMHPLIAEFFLAVHENKRDGPLTDCPEVFARVTGNYLGLPDDMLKTRSNILKRVSKQVPKSEEYRALRWTAHIVCLGNSRRYWSLRTPTPGSHAFVFAFVVKSGKRIFVGRNLKVIDREKRDFLLFECMTEEPDADLQIIDLTFPKEGFDLDLSGSMLGMVITEIPKEFCFCNTFVKSVAFSDNIVSIGRASFSDCSNISGDLKLPNSLTAIKAYVFKGCSSITSVTIPGSVKDIGYKAFYGCTNVESVTFSDGLISIGGHAFRDCCSLTSISIPGSVTSIGEHAFRDCKSLRSVAISEGVTVIDEDVFSGCSSLESMTIPESVTQIKYGAFNGCGNLKCVTIPDQVEKIERAAFKNCISLTSVTIPDGVTSIGAEAFKGCTSLKNVTIPESVTSVGHNAFEKTQWLSSQPEGFIYAGHVVIGYTGKETDIKIPESVTSIAHSAFQGCKNLKSVTIPGGVTEIGWSAFADCSRLTSVTIPDSVTEIGWDAFQNCSSLTSIKIPESVIKIGRHAFQNCKRLENVTIPERLILDADHICDAFQNGSSLTSIKTPKIVIRHAFQNGSSLTSIKTPKNTKRIGRHAFQNRKRLENMTIPERLIPDADHICDAFEGTPWLMSQEGVINAGEIIPGYTGNETSIEIPEGVTSIIDRGFYYQMNLFCVTIPEGVTSIGAYAFEGCKNLTSLTIPEGVTSIGAYAFEGCKNLKSVTIPESMTEIGWNAFENCSSLESVTIPGSVTEMRCGAFEGCTSLKSVTINEGLTEIGSNAFKNCDSLTNVTLPSSLISIGEQAFEGCSSLTNVTIPNSVISIGGNAFWGCNDLIRVTLPEGLTEIKVSTFYYCNSLTSVTIPEGVEKIGCCAFSGCRNLTSVIIPDGVKYIGESAFSHCHRLKSVIIPRSIEKIGLDAFDMELYREKIVTYSDGEICPVPNTRLF